MNDPPLCLNVWQRFWHEPVRAERLAATRIFLGAAALTDQLVQYLPFVPYLYGPRGVAPAGSQDEWLLRIWHLNPLVFNTDNLTVIWALFWLRLGVTLAFLVGWHTRLMCVLLYLLSWWFLYRNPALINKGDEIMLVTLFLLMFAPSGRALSVDRWLRHRRQEAGAPGGPEYTAAWPVRLLQIQLCMIYLTTGLAKLLTEEPFTGPWWDGTMMHYVLNDITLSRWSYAQLPLPLWFTAPLTYLVVWWEVLFTVLVLFPRTRWLAPWFGVLFHLGIWLTIDVGWFSFYSLALYGVWIPGDWWDRPRFASRK